MKVIITNELFDKMYKGDASICGMIQLANRAKFWDTIAPNTIKSAVLDGDYFVSRTEDSDYLAVGTGPNDAGEDGVEINFKGGNYWSVFYNKEIGEWYIENFVDISDAWHTAHYLDKEEAFVVWDNRFNTYYGYRKVASVGDRALIVGNRVYEVFNLDTKELTAYADGADVETGELVSIGFANANVLGPYIREEK